MKTCLLRDSNAVEPQKTPRPLRVPLARPLAAAVAAPGPVLSIGLDVHNDSIAVSLAASDATEVRRYGDHWRAT